MAGAADVGGAVGGGLGSFFGPLGSSIGAGLGKGLGSAIGGEGGGPISSGATAATYGTMLGNDGWSVNFSGQQVAMPSSNKTASYPADQTPNPLMYPQPVQAGMGGGSGWLAVAVLAFVALKLIKGAM